MAFYPRSGPSRRPAFVSLDEIDVPVQDRGDGWSSLSLGVVSTVNLRQWIQQGAPWVTSTDRVQNIDPWPVPEDESGRTVARYVLISHREWYRLAAAEAAAKQFGLVIAGLRDQHMVARRFLYLAQTLPYAGLATRREHGGCLCYPVFTWRGSESIVVLHPCDGLLSPDTWVLCIEPEAVGHGQPSSGFRTAA
ncbi:MAG: hypothetical protein HY461_01710 [Parcubacteria group bacterium]|nr:hypothetical protein [Parcubacteria group bacterium]